MDHIKAVCFDVSKTLVYDTSWYEFNTTFGMTPEEDKMFFDLYEEGIIDYEIWMHLIKNIVVARSNPTLAGVRKVLTNYKYIDFEEQSDLIEYLKGKGYEILIITGSMKIVAESVAQELGIENYFATNELVFEEGYLVDIKTVGAESEAKLNILRGFLEQKGIGLSECACIADGDNDLPMFNATGKGITFRDSRIADMAWKVVDKIGDVKNIL